MFALYNSVPKVAAKAAEDIIAPWTINYAYKTTSMIEDQALDKISINPSRHTWQGQDEPVSIRQKEAVSEVEETRTIYTTGNPLPESSNLLPTSTEMRVVTEASQTIQLVSTTTIVSEVEETSPTRIDLTFSSSSGIEVVGSLSHELFGGVLINNGCFESFQRDYKEVGLSFIRYPGGTYAEKGIVIDGILQFTDSGTSLSSLLEDRSQFIIDLTFPELFNPELLAMDNTAPESNNFASLSELFLQCIEQGAPASIILPVRRYYSGIDVGDSAVLNDMLALAENDLRLFLDRLLSGAYNDGKYPDELILEIGNENYSTPIEYALFSRMMIRTIEDVLRDSDINYKIAFQMNIGSGKFTDLLDAGYFENFYDVNGVSRHDWLSDFPGGSPEEVGFPGSITALETIMAGVLGDATMHIDMLRQHYLALDADNLSDEGALIHQRVEILEYWLSLIEERGGDPSSIEFFVSAWTADSSNAGSYPAGLAAAGNILMATEYFVRIGVDLAAAWGFNGSEDYWPENSPTTVISFTNNDSPTPGFEVLRLLSAYATGKELVDATSLGEPSPDESLDLRQFIYWSDAEITVFFSIGDFGGSSLVLNVDLSELGYFNFAKVVSVGTEDGSDFGIAHTEEYTTNVDDGVVTLNFVQDYQVFMINLENEATYGTEGSDTLNGTSDFDVLYGRAGDDVLSGWDGDDHLFGENGDDQLYGNKGSDELFGNDGDDTIRGGDGTDYLYGGGGNDYIYGQSGDDHLFGGVGSDILIGGEGNDVLNGSAFSSNSGEDQLAWGVSAEEGVDEDWADEVLSLYAGNMLDGGDGDDLLIGSKGSDVFVFNGGHDVIENLQAGFDQILLELDDALVGSYDSLNEKYHILDDGIILTFDADTSLTVIGVDEFSVLSESLALEYL